MADKKKVVAAKKVVYANARDVARKQDQAGGGYKAIKAPAGMEMYKWEKGPNVLDVIPYVSSGGNPNCDKGLAAPERTYFIHTNVGPAKKQVVCPAETFGKPCPVCEHSAKMLRKGTLTEETKSALRAKMRQLMVVRVHANKKALAILECGHFKTFGEMLKNKILGLREGHPCENFFSLDEGATMTVLCTDQKFDGGKFIGPASIELEPREKAIPESILDKVPDLDKLVKDATLKYEEIKELFEGGVGADGDEDDDEVDADGDGDEVDADGDGDEVEEEDEPAPKKKGKKKAVVEEDEEEEVEEDQETESEDDEVEDADEDEDTPAIEKGSTVSFMSKTKKKVYTGVVIKIKGEMVHVKDPKGAWHEAVDLDDCTLVEDEEDETEDDEVEEDEEEEPAPKKKVKGKKAAAVEEEDEEEESDDEDEPFDGDDEDFDTNSDDEDEEDEEEPEPVVKKKAKKK